MRWYWGILMLFVIPIVIGGVAVIMETPAEDKVPYGMYSSTETQTIAVANTAYPVTFNNIEDDYLITMTKSNFTFPIEGDYLVIVSAIIDVDTPNKHVELWVQKNNADIVRSNTIVQAPSAAAELTLVVPFILDAKPTDKFRFMYASDDAGSRLLYTTNTTHSPATPSIIVTMNRISDITP